MTPFFACEIKNKEKNSICHDHICKKKNDSTPPNKHIFKFNSPSHIPGIEYGQGRKRQGVGTGSFIQKMR